MVRYYQSIWGQKRYIQRLLDTISYGDRSESYKITYPSVGSVVNQQEILTISLDKEDYNYDDITLSLSVKDAAGNEAKTSYTFTICTDEPTVSISMAGKKDQNSAIGAYYNSDRVATIAIKHNGRNVADKDSANNAIVGIDSTVRVTWSEDRNHDLTGTLNFTEEGNYNWSFDVSKYANKAGLKCEASPTILEGSDGDVYESSLKRETKFMYKAYSIAGETSLTDVSEISLSSIAGNTWVSFTVFVNGDKDEVEAKEIGEHIGKWYQQNGIYGSANVIAVSPEAFDSINFENYQAVKREEGVKNLVSCDISLSGEVVIR